MTASVLSMQQNLENNSEMNFPSPYINRELSWLAFNSRVLEEANNVSHPLLERLRFLSICGNNLDEFYMVRVSGLRELVKNKSKTQSSDGLSPSEQLERINEVAGQIMDRQQIVWAELKQELSENGIHILSLDDMENIDVSDLRERFLEEVYPILTPLAIDPAHPFPFIPNLGFVKVFELFSKINGKRLNSLVPLPAVLPRFWEVKREGKDRYHISLETMVELFSDTLFPNFEVLSSGVFRIIRDSDIELEEEAEDLIVQAEAALRERRRGEVVRLKVNASMSEDLRELIRDQMGVSSKDLVVVNGVLGVSQLSQLIPDDMPELKFKPFEPRFPERIIEYGNDCFAAIRAKDILVHHPFESFDVVVQFIKQAASDPNVVAIKQTLYRTSSNSPIVAALIEAAESGKIVTAIVEIKARFDEEANLKWARDLEKAGVHVVFGFISLKTHAKVSLVIRREGKKLKYYTHFGTGNYHPITAKIYTDLSLFTADEDLGADAGKLFNFITGYAVPRKMKKLLMSPLTLKPEILELIDNEIANVKEGKPAGIWAKLNSLVDTDIIDKLYEASQAGVKIELVIRGMCSLRPGVVGLSENIRVKSIIGRFLEHSRIVCFANGHPLPSPDAKVFISSADWMPRNLERRVETLVPIENQTVHRQIIEEIMLSNLNDVAQSWIMHPDGTYTKAPIKDGYEFSAHEYFMSNPSLSGRGSAFKDRRGDK